MKGSLGALLISPLPEPLTSLTPVPLVTAQRAITTFQTEMQFRKPTLVYSALGAWGISPPNMHT